MATLASDWLRYFWLLLKNCWTEFSETCHEARTQRPLPSLSFTGWSWWLPQPLIGWHIFSSPEPKAGVSYCNSASSVRPSSVRRKLSHFRLLLWNRWMEFNETWQKARSQRPLPSLCFSSRSEKQDGRPSLWLAETFSTSPLKRLNGIQQNLTGSKISRPFTKFVFSGQSEKQDGRPGLWLAETFSTSPLKRLNGIQRNLTGSKISTPSTKFVFFGPIGREDGRPGLWLAETLLTSFLKPLNGIQRNLTGSKISTPSTKFVFFEPIEKTRWPPWPLIGLDILDFSSETAERNLTKLDRKQDLNALYQVCVFRADRRNKMAALASDWLRHFRLLFWNRWTEFNKTWQEARSQRHLPSLCFSSRSEKQDGRPGLWLAETFWTSPLKRLNGIQRNLTGSKISTPSTKFVFFGPIGETRWPPWPLIGWDIFDFSSQTDERNSTNLDRKQDLNAIYQVCVFRADGKNKMAALASSEAAERISMKLDRKQDLKALYQVCVFQVDQKNKMATPGSDWLRRFRLFLWNPWTEFNETWQEARSQRPLPSLRFSGWSEKQDSHPGLLFAETFSTSLKPLNGIQRNLTESKFSMSSTKFVFYWAYGKTIWPLWPLIDWDIFWLFLWNRWTELK